VRNLEAALEGVAIADSDFVENVGIDAWKSIDCFCPLDPGATAINTGFTCDPNYPDKTVDLYFYKENPN